MYDIVSSFQNLFIAQPSANTTILKHDWKNPIML